MNIKIFGHILEIFYWVCITTTCGAASEDTVRALEHPVLEFQCLHETSILTGSQNNQSTFNIMKGQSEIAYLPKFANMMLIVMVIVITEILYIILIFDCFAENQ